MMPEELRIISNNPENDDLKGNQKSLRQFSGKTKLIVKDNQQISHDFSVLQSYEQQSKTKTTKF